MKLTKADFGADFKWGISTAAYQIEGGHNIDEKGPSIWDEFVKKPGKIFQKQHGQVACDFYNRYPEDNALIKSLNIPNHRFSISWSRILPEGTGRISRKGIDFYNRLIDHSLALGIVPWITLYHWDLPQSLEEDGGWTNRNIIQWFSNYTEICCRYFGDRVKNWIILNEPMVFTGAGYFLGIHAPGKKGLHNFLSAVHHAALCQAEGGRIIRRLLPESKIGTTFSSSYVEPYRLNKKDIIATKKVDALLNRLFIEPLLGLGYPVKDLKILQRIEQFMKPGDETKLAFDMDFIGIQNYTRELVAHSSLMPFVKAKIVKANKRNVETTLMNWEVYPEAMYHVLKKFGAYKNIPQLLVTENGAAFKDETTDGKIEDHKRTQFIADNITQLLKAKREGVKVNGYFIWTLLDNFEWAEGYYPKFGLVHVDFESQKRIIKSSGHWYSNFLQDT
ncbi:MAG: GH1 family beta-glucosidase [Ferruginibacter sp.]